MALVSSSYGSFFKESLSLHRAIKRKTQDESSSVTSLIENSSRRSYCFPKIWTRKIRRIHLKGAILVLVLSFLVWGALWVSFSELFLPGVDTSSSNKFAFKQGASYLFAHHTIIIVVFLVGTPLSGWLADAYLGRYKVLQGSLWILLCGLIIRHVTDLVYIYGFSPQNKEDTSSAPFLVLLIVHSFGSVLQWSGGFGFLSNIIQFGVDQMSDASTSEVSAFIFWYVFALNLGIWATQGTIKLVADCLRTSGDTEVVIEMILPVLFVSLTLILNVLFRKYLTVEPQTKNPFKLIFVVLKYAATHKELRIRSAFTYMDEPPSRLDLGKFKFGGPFTTEQVEDVKTFMRILFLMCPTPLIVIPLFLIASGLELTPSDLGGHSGSVCSHSLIATFVYNRHILIALHIMLYELVIYPMMRRRITTMLRRIVAGAFILCILCTFLLVVDIVGHEVTHNPVCMFDSTSAGNSTSGINPIALYSVEIIGSNLQALVTTLLSTAAYEFIYAQSPHYMRGILMGFVWFIFTLSSVLATITFVMLREKWVDHPLNGIPICGILYYSTSLFIAILGLVLFGFTACCYKYRVRDDVRNETAVIEEVYAKRCAMENSVN